MAFKSFTDNDKVLNLYSTVAEPMWSSVTTSELLTFFTGSVQDSNNGKYYYDVHGTSDQTTDVEFAVSYGHRLGSGSEDATTTGTNPTKAIYSQLRQVMLPAQTTQFNFSGGGATNYYSDDIFIISVNRARYREKMDPGNWELHLTSGSNTIKLIDDSGANKNAQIGSSKREFNVVSGSVLSGVYTTASASAAATNSGSYGLFYPETGMVILNPNSLAASGSYGSNHSSSMYIEPLGTSADSNDLNHRKLFASTKTGAYFASRREEQKRSSMYFCKVMGGEYNHSQNPSYFTGTNAEIFNRSFITEPRSYITSVGLYNDNNELLAVAKMSQPFKKDQNTEALIKVKLDY